MIYLTSVLLACAVLRSLNHTPKVQEVDELLHKIIYLLIERAEHTWLQKQSELPTTISFNLRNHLKFTSSSFRLRRSRYGIPVFPTDIYSISNRRIPIWKFHEMFESISIPFFNILVARPGLIIHCLNKSIHLKNTEFTVRR